MSLYVPMVIIRSAISNTIIILNCVAKNVTERCLFNNRDERCEGATTHLPPLILTQLKYHKCSICTAYVKIRIYLDLWSTCRHGERFEPPWQWPLPDFVPVL